MTSVLLVNMPFGSTRYPSLALGLFKAALSREEGVRCDVAYLNVRFASMVGWEHYELINTHSALLAGEQMFARSLFGGRVPSEAEYEADIGRLVPEETVRRIGWMRSQVEPFLEACLSTIPFGRYDVVGFTSLFEQQLPSLSLANRVKQRHPETLVVFGGANCEDVMGRTLHQYFPFIDHVCTGEGDVAFPELVRRLSRGEPTDDIPGITARRGQGLVANGRPERPAAMDDLPFPDYTEYFDALRSAHAPPDLRPSVLMETSRGCWWGAKVMCTFCGLNGSNIAFRHKTAPRALAEAEHLAERYDVDMIRTVDNIMPASYFEDFLPGLAELELGVDFFYELRAVMPKEHVRRLAAARVTSVQAGIEQISTKILKLMRKGTSALGNIEFLKWCRQYGVHVDWNLLFGFPGEDAEDYRSVLRTARLLTHLEAPTSVGRIRLDRFSENFVNAEARGFDDVRPWHLYRYVYPLPREALERLVYYFDFDYREPIDDGGALPGIAAHIGEWRARGDRLLVEFRDGRAFLTDTRAVAPVERRTLTGAAAELYRFCDARRTVDEAVEHLRERGGSAEAEEVRAELDRLVAARVMIQERSKYLSLAIPVRPARPADADRSARVGSGGGRTRGPRS